MDKRCIVEKKLQFGHKKEPQPTPIRASTEAPELARRAKFLLFSVFMNYLQRFHQRHIEKSAKIKYDNINIEKSAPFGALGGLRCGVKGQVEKI